jgi:hypothetical protein
VSSPPKPDRELGAVAGGERPVELENWAIEPTVSNGHETPTEPEAMGRSYSGWTAV